MSILNKLDRFKEFCHAYLVAAFWTLCEEDEILWKDQCPDASLEEPESLEQFVDSYEWIEHCLSFLMLDVGDGRYVFELLDDDQYSQAGHDFWLTRNGHGSGFWDNGDKGYSEEVAAILDNLSVRQGEALSYWDSGSSQIVITNEC